MGQWFVTILHTKRYIVEAFCNTPTLLYKYYEDIIKGLYVLKNIKELSFSEYYLSKQKLLEKAEDTPRIYSEYELKAYKKVPLKESYDDDDKIYISFKPKDRIKILWEYEDIYYPTARNFVVISEDGSSTYYPCWGSKKLLKWVMVNARELESGNNT